MRLQLFGESGSGAIEKLIDQVADAGETAVKQADASAEKAADKVEDVLDKAEQILLDPNATGAHKKEVLDQLEELLPKMREVTDKWLALESTGAELQAKAFISQPMAEAAPGTATTDSSQGPLQLEDKTAPLEIPVPAVQTAAEQPQGSGLSRLWKALW